MEASQDRRGVLYPAQLPKFERILPPADLSDVVAWFWLVRWDISPGRVSRQQLLPFPLMNLVVQTDGVTLSGPATSASHRDLSGKGWAVAALLRPAATDCLEVSPAQLCDREVPFTAPDLWESIHGIAGRGQGPAVNQACANEFGNWVSQTWATPETSGLLANTFVDYVGATTTAVSVEQVATELGLSVRSLQRLSLHYLGLPPLSVIRRYRLQEAAQRVRENPSTSIAQIAAELRYTDQAHLASDFRKVLGFSPSAYRVRNGSNR